MIKKDCQMCIMCGKHRDLRFGWCWDCAEAQNILVTGKDMWEDDPKDETNNFPIPLVNERLKRLIEKGWGTGSDRKLPSKEEGTWSGTKIGTRGDETAVVQITLPIKMRPRQ